MSTSDEASTEESVSSPVERSWRAWVARLALASLLLVAMPACGLLGDDGADDDEQEQVDDGIPTPPGRP